MRVNIDLDSRRLYTGATTSSLRTEPYFLKRRDRERVEIVFIYEGRRGDLISPSAVGFMGVKARGDIDGPLVAAADNWIKTGSGSNALYSFNLNLNTPEIEAMFAPESETYAFLADFEIVWFDSGYIMSSATFPMVIENDLIQGNEGVPTQPPIESLSPYYLRVEPNITGITGGGVENLDGIPTGGGVGTYPLGVLVYIVIAGLPAMYQLVAGTEEENPPFVVRPDDFDLLLNPKVWIKRI